MDEPRSLETPFSSQQATVRVAKRGNTRLIAGVGALCLVFVVIGIILGKSKGSSDQYRTMEAFPVADFMENYESLQGGRFKLSGIVDAELGTEEGTGKLVTFRDSQSKKVVPVLIPDEVMPNHSLSKSQRYKVVLEVGRGGVLSATNLEKE